MLDHHVDIVCIGEGEETVVELADYYIGNRDKEGIKGISFRGEDGIAVFTERRPLIKDLDTIPYPDFNDFPIRYYTGSDNPMSNPIFWSLFSSRGCPFDCIFCSSHNVFGRTMRVRSAENVYREIRSLHDHFGVQVFAFQDDELLCNKKRFIEFCDILAASDLNPKISIRTRIDSIDPEVLEKAKAAGITRISFGIESWNDETLDKINKKYSVATIHERFRYISEAQPLHVSFNNINGFPWEGKDHFDSIVAEIAKIPRNVHFFTNSCTPIPFPKTKLYEMYHKEYGFTDWWLDPENHPKPMKGHPFFLSFAGMFSPLYVNNDFWGYSKVYVQQLENLSWQLFRLMLDRHYDSRQGQMIYRLCRLSHRLWKINPVHERMVAVVLKRMPTLANLAEPLNFTTKY